MSATEIIDQIEKLSAKDQQQVFVHLTRKVLAGAPEPKSSLGKKLTFEEACDVVFRENREVLNALAK